MVVSAVAQLKPPALAALAQLARTGRTGERIGDHALFAGLSKRLDAAVAGQLTSLGLAVEVQHSHLVSGRGRPQPKDVVKTNSELLLTPWGRVVADALAEGHP
jgi:hypothetical protein